MKLSKAQQMVIDTAKERIDFARAHTFYEWYRRDSHWSIQEMTDEEIDAHLGKVQEYIGSKKYYEERYNMNRDGIDYLCRANSKTIKKLEDLGLITIIYDSNGETYGFDRIKINNY